MRYPWLMLAVSLLIGLFVMPARSEGTIQLPEEVFTTPGPHVVVNGVLLKAPVKMVNGSLLLPMRPVFEALQAEVKWFPAAQQITATRGTTVVQLWINKTVAIIGDKETVLATPPTLMDGTTFVPLRFPAEAFGGEVKWNGPLQTAVITIPELGKTPSPPSVPSPVPAPAKSSDVGVIVGKTTEIGQALLIQDAAGDTVVRPLPSGVILTRNPVGGTVKAATFAEFQPGDAVKFTLDANGKISAVAATFIQVTGKVAAIANNKLMLQDGALFSLHPEVKTTDIAGKAVALATIGNGCEVILRVTPGTTTVWTIVVPVATTPLPTPPTAKQPTILTVGALGYTGPVKAGDSVTIQVSGTPGADSVIAKIGDVILAVPLSEIEPGKYQKKVQIAANTNATAVPITAVMKLGTETTTEVKSTQLITIDTTAPVFNRLLPAQDTQIYDRNLTIDAAFSDPGGSGVDPQAVNLKFDGVDVTKMAVISEKSVSFKGQNLALGTHTVHLQIADQAKNTAVVEWKVIISAIPANVPVATLTHDAIKPVTVGQVVGYHAALTAEPVMIEWYLGTKLINTMKAPLVHDPAGPLVYSMKRAVDKTDPIGNITVSIRVYSDATHSQVIYADKPLVISAVERPLTITSPADKSKAPAQLTISGEGPVGAAVRVTVSYSKAILLAVLKGDVYKGTVAIDADGKWTTPAFDTEVLIGRVDQYSVTAEILDDAGNVKQTASLTLTGK